MYIFKTGLSSLSDWWAKYKEKVPDVSDSNQILTQHTIPNTNLQNLKKIYSSKDVFLKFQIFSRRGYFRLWVFA